LKRRFPVGHLRRFLTGNDAGWLRDSGQVRRCRSSTNRLRDGLPPSPLPAVAYVGNSAPGCTGAGN
jgi:hypothetical protein